MASDWLKDKVKDLIGLTKNGKPDEAFDGYVKLFEMPELLDETVEDRRKAIRLVVNAKVIPNKISASQKAAHRAAMIPLKATIAELGEPQDMETLGICHAILGEDQLAAAVFRNALNIERARDSGSVLCGSLMKWVAAV